MMPAASQQGYSVLVLTFNESANIERCLASLKECDDIVVLDSFSTDDTLDLVSRYPARVHQRRFDSFAGQRNWAIRNLSFKHHWILHLDADECLTPELHEELLQVIARDEKSAYLIANKIVFMGRWIRRSSMFPHYQARLLRLGEAEFVQKGHGQTLGATTRGVGVLQHAYWHHNFSKGIADWVTRHNRYSTDEANRIHRDRGDVFTAVWQALTASTQEGKQQARKRLADAIPCRPLVRFVYLYLVRLGFLDGAPGFRYCILMSFYDYLVRLKVRELNERARRAESSGWGESAK
jgi:glycosyltransferase involved in cell wall biosynthesis